MGGVFAFVRPYSRARRERLVELLHSLGYHQGEGLILSPRTPDVKAAAWASRLDVDLLVLPFHLHRDVEGKAVDGIGVAALLAESFEQRGIPILMPISRYSFSAGFFSRLTELEAARPKIAELVVPLQEGDDDEAQLAARLRLVRRSVATGRHLTPAVIRRPDSRPPPTVRHGRGYSGRSPRVSLEFSLVPPRVSLGPPSSGTSDGAPYESGAFPVERGRSTAAESNAGRASKKKAGS